MSTERTEHPAIQTMRDAIFELEALTGRVDGQGRRNSVIGRLRCRIAELQDPGIPNQRLTRDQFAIEAMKVLMTQAPLYGTPYFDKQAPLLAEAAYMLAAAMINRRERGV